VCVVEKNDVTEGAGGFKKILVLSPTGMIIYDDEQPAPCYCTMLRIWDRNSLTNQNTAAASDADAVPLVGGNRSAMME